VHLARSLNHIRLPPLSFIRTHRRRRVRRDVGGTLTGDGSQASGSQEEGGGGSETHGWVVGE